MSKCVTGFWHSVCLSTDGFVHSFGCNMFGQLGLGNKENTSFPISIPNLPKIKQVSCGLHFTVCVDEEGFIWSFGNNDFGQLGLGNTNTYNSPQKITEIPSIHFVSCGGYHTLILTNDSILWSTGKNNFGQLCLGDRNRNYEPLTKPEQTPYSNIKNIYAGCAMSFFENSKGELYGCGSNDKGSLGLGHKNHPQFSVCLVPCHSNNIIQFCCGYYHSLFLDEEGNVYSAGLNQYGNLGLNCYSNKNLFTQISNIPPIDKISCVGDSSYLLDFDGNIWSFGMNDFGQLGHGGEIIVPLISSLKNINDISHGFGSHFFAKDSSHIYALGDDSYGQLGLKRCGNSDVNHTTLNFKIWGGSNKDYNRIKSARK